MKYFFSSILKIWLVSVTCQLWAQETTAFLSDPNAPFWSQFGGSLEKPLPVEEMSPVQIAQQQELNKLYGHEFVLSYSHYSDSLLFPENNYDLPVTLRRIDNEPITPYNWRWISLELEEPNGQVLTAHLRRPSWWIANNDAGEIGNLVYLNLPEMAISGWSKVTGIRPSYIDTRVATFDSEGNYCYRPITGWFTRMAPETRDFFFSTGDTIGATPNHLFFSETRQEYVPAGELEIGEQVKLASGEAASFAGKGARSVGPEQVYNLEVWRGHNYHVGNYGLLVHNDCDLGDIREDIKRWKKGEFPLSDPPTRFQKVVEKLAELGDNHLEQFLADFKGTNGKIDLGVFDEGMVEAWIILRNFPPNRKNASDLKAIGDFLKINPAVKETIIEQLSIVDKPEKIVNGLTIGVLRKFRKSNTQDIQKINEIWNYYNPATSNKNVAFSTGDINGSGITLESVSGYGYTGEYGNLFPPPLPPPHYLVTPIGEGHTEQKICEFLYSLHRNSPNINGSIEIVSKKEMCLSCLNVIDLFQKDFPNIQVVRVELTN